MKRVFMMCLMFVIASMIVGCNNYLSYSKDKEKEEINNYFELLNEDDYSKENWNIIRDIVYKNNNLIDVEEEMKQIENIKNIATKKIDRVKPSKLTEEWLIKNFDINEEKYIVLHQLMMILQQIQYLYY